MSQIYKSSASGPAPPTVPTQFTTDDGSKAIPAANNLNVFPARWDPIFEQQLKVDIVF